MLQKEIFQLTDQELLDKAKKMKSSPMLNALVIGCMIGVIVYSVVKNTYGFLTLVPLYFIYQLVKNSKNNKALEEELKARNLK